MHEVDHCRRCIRLSQCCRHAGERPWPECCATKLNRQHQSQEAAFAQRLNCLDGKSPLFVVLTCRRRKNVVGNLSSG
jgi:hypothetical protein